MKPFASVLLVCQLIALAISGLSQTQTVPFLVNYQGKLLAADGTPLPTADYTLSFKLFDSAQGGTLIWGPQIFDGIVAETGHGPRIPVVQGHFNVILGPLDNASRSIALAFTNGFSRFLEIAVAASPPILPRQQILTAPFAFQAENARHAANALEAVHATNANHAVQADSAGNASRLAGFDWGRVFVNPNILNSLVKDSILPGDLVRTNSLDHLDAADGTPANAVVVDASGNVGIGTNAPSLARLHVVGSGSSTVRIGARAADGLSKILYFGGNNVSIGEHVTDVLRLQAPRLEVQAPSLAVLGATTRRVYIPGTNAEMQVEGLTSQGATLRLGKYQNDAEIKKVAFGNDDTYIGETATNTISITTGPQGKLKLQADTVLCNDEAPIHIRKFNMPYAQTAINTGWAADKYVVVVVGTWQVQHGQAYAAPVTDGFGVLRWTLAVNYGVYNTPPYDYKYVVVMRILKQFVTTQDL